MLQASEVRAHFSAGQLAGLLAALLASLLGGCDRPRDPEPPARASQHAEVAASPWTSREACESAPATVIPPGRARIATWNVRWFPDGRPGGHDPARTTDVEWLACAIARLGASVVALQEILLHERGREALDRVRRSLDRRTGGRWEAHDDGCPAGTQQLVLLADASRARVTGVRSLAALNPIGEGPCAHRLRPGLAAQLRFTGGLDLTIVDLHLDSGTSRRDHEHRRASLAALRRERPALGDDDVVVLGDFNSMGCRECTPRITPEAEIAALDAELEAAGLARALPTERCTEYDGSRRALLDHVAVSRATEELPRGARARVEGVCAELACRSAPREAEALARLSDHCPVVIELEDVDRDR